MSFWTTKIFSGVTFSWLGGQLVSITYNDGMTRTTFDPSDSNKFLNTTHESENVSMEYYHLCGNAVAGLSQIRDADLIVSPGKRVVVLNDRIKAHEKRRKIRMYRGMLNFQLTTVVPDEIQKIWRENKKL